MNNKSIEKRFEIKRDDKIKALFDKYENYCEGYLPADDEPMAAIATRLNEWERCVFYALAEYKTITAFAAFFGTTKHHSWQTIIAIKEKVKAIKKTMM